MSAFHGTYGQGSVSTAGVGLLNRLPANSRTAKTAAHARHVELDARRERDEMRYVLDSIGIGFWDWDVPSLEVWYSSYVQELLGYTRDDAGQMVNIFRELIHPDDEEHTEAAQNAILYGEEDSYRAEFRVRHKQGHWVWIEAIGRVVVRAQDGTALRLAGTFNGIDARRQEQADSAFLNALTQELLEQTDPDAIKRIAIRRLGQYLAADRVSFGRLNSQRESLIVDMDWLGADVPPLAGEWSANNCKPTITYILDHHTHVVVRDAAEDPIINDDDTRDLFASTETQAAIAIPLIISGKVHGLLLITQATPRNWQDHEIHLAQSVATRLWDSVLRARAVERSKADKNLLKLALRMAKLTARERDPHTGAVRTSDNFFAVMGHPDVEWMSTDEYVSHVHPEDRERFVDNVLKPEGLRGSGTVSDEYRIISADEQIRYIAMLAEYFVPSGKVGERAAHSAAIFQDVTEHKERELETGRARDQLLKQSRLSAMGVMASTLAHELNQPLATAANYLSLVEALTIEDPAKASVDLKEYLARALSKVLEAGEIIRRVRSYTAEGEVKRSPHSLRDLVFRGLSSLFGRAGADEIAIINAVAKEVMVEVDALMIEHAFVNVVRNAVDALKGTANPRIHISAVRSGSTFKLLIADNGPGMSAEVAANLFSPFVTAKSDGTGLGLPICRTMVEANGGKIALHAMGPEGTTFCICLPAAQTSEHQGETI